MKFILVTLIIFSQSICFANKHKMNNNKLVTGFKFESVKPGSIYEQMGLKSGDILNSYDGVKILSASDAMEFYNKFFEKKVKSVTLIRDGKVKTFNI